MRRGREVYGLGGFVPPAPPSPSGKFLDATGNFSTPANTPQSSSFALTGIISPSLTGNTNDWAPSGLSGAATVRMGSLAAYNVTGLTGGSAGRLLKLHNISAFTVTLKDESASSTAANRFTLGGADLAIPSGHGVELQYDATSSRWRALNPGSSGGFTSPLTTKGDLHTYSTTDDRLGAGADGKVLVSSSGQSTGLGWYTMAALLYGLGTDGSVTLDGASTPSWATRSGNDYTLSRSVDLNVLTFSSSSITLKTNGFVIRAQEIAGDGIIHWDGLPASGTTGGLNLNGGIFGSCATAGAAGKASSIANGNNASGTSPSVGGSGGNGGAAGIQTGGTGGTASALGSAGQGFKFDPFMFLAGRTLGASGLTIPQGGCGGGGGAQSALGNSGAGGGGAGIVIVCAKIISGSCTIRANGGNGSAATSGTSGGGGGGGGGAVYVAYLLKTGSPTFQANGGSPGAGFGGGSSGVAGSNGNVFELAGP